MADITGSYKLVESINFDKYMDAIGVNFILKNMANAMPSAVVDVTKDGPTYTLKTTTTLKSSEIKFELGKPVEETTIDGRKVQSVFNLEGNVLKQKQTGDKGFESTIDREFTPEGLITTIRYKDVTATRKYTKA